MAIHFNEATCGDTKFRSERSFGTVREHEGFISGLDTCDGIAISSYNVGSQHVLCSIPLRHVQRGYVCMYLRIYVHTYIDIYVALSFIVEHAVI